MQLEEGLARAHKARRAELFRSMSVERCENLIAEILDARISSFDWVLLVVPREKSERWSAAASGAGDPLYVWAESVVDAAADAAVGRATK